MTRIGALVVISALAVTGCSPDPIEQYLGQMRDITVTMQRASIAALPDRTSITRQGVSGVNEARRAALESLATVVPPTGLAPEHRALEIGLGDLVRAADDILVATADLSPEQFAEAIASAVNVDEIALRVAAACTALEQRGVALGYTVTLAC